MKKHFAIIILITFLTSCSSLQLSPANFAWPVENELTPKPNGDITEQRYSLKFNVTNLFSQEFGPTWNKKFTKIRIIRNSAGFYFLTSKGFRHVYVFTSGNASFDLFNTIPVEQNGLTNPAFNQRTEYIELLTNNSKIRLDENGVFGGKK